jgi:hypothetical protein
MLSHRCFYYDDGNGRMVVIRLWLPYGHPDRVVTEDT